MEKRKKKLEIDMQTIPEESHDLKDARDGEKIITLPNKWKALHGVYKLTHLVGNGSSSKVVKAKHRATGKTVAIKMIDGVFSDHYRTLRIIREVQIMRNLTQMANNKFVPNLYDVVYCEKKKCLFIVMEYMQSDLRKVMTSVNEQPLEQEHILVIIYKFLCALNYLSSANVIHRDIQPSNVLVDENCNIKICDFNSARSQVKFELKKLERSRAQRAAILEKTRTLREEQEREISPHVYSRWYRPPEVILRENSYNTTADIWSSGCILAELIFCQRDYISLGAKVEDRHIFEGDSCFPLSPKKDNLRTNCLISKDDQLRKILLTLGEHSSEDFSFISDENALQYCRKIQSKDEKINFQKEFPKTNKGLLEILENMLEFNPFFRSSIKDLLKHKIFDSVRKCYPGLEIEAPWKIQLACDKKDAIKYDEPVEPRMTMQKLENMLQEEIEVVKSMRIFEQIPENDQKQ